MSKDIQCPYCYTMLEEDTDANEPDCHNEYECGGCGKTFGYTFYYEKVYTEYELPCANGEEHNFVPIFGYPQEYYKDKFECSYCGERK